MSFTDPDLIVTGTDSNILGGGVSSFYDASVDASNIFILTGGVIVENDTINQNKTNTIQIIKYDPVASTFEVIYTTNNTGIVNDSGNDTSANYFIYSSIYDEVSSATIVQVNTASNSISVIPRLYSNLEFEEGAASTIYINTTPSTFDYCAIGVPRYTENGVLKGTVLIYRKFDTGPWIFFSQLLTNMDSPRSDRPFFGYTLKFLFLNTSELHLAVCSPEFDDEDSLTGNTGYVEFYNVTGSYTGILTGVDTQKNFGLGMACTPATGNIFVLSANNVTSLGTKKQLHIYKDTTGTTVPTDDQIIEEEFSVSPAVSITPDNEVIVSGITHFTNNTSGYFNIYKLNSSNNDYQKVYKVSPFVGSPVGYSLSVCPKINLANEYSITSGSNPLSLAPINDFGKILTYSGAISAVPPCPEEVEQNVFWEQTAANTTGVEVNHCGVPGYIPDPDEAVPPFSRDCDANGVWTTPAAGCVKPANSCDALIENNINWPVTFNGLNTIGTCVEGTVNTSNFPLIRSCVEEEWDPALFSCTPLLPECAVQTVNNVVWSKTSAGDTATGTCKVGKVLADDRPLSRYCNQLGVWEETDLYCVDPTVSLSDKQYIAVVLGTILGMAVFVALIIIFILRG